MVIFVVLTMYYTLEIIILKRWMAGELHDAARPQEDKEYDIRMVQTGHTMQTALRWLGLYYY